MVSSLHLAKCHNDYLIAMNETMENYELKSLIESKGELIDIGLSDPRSDDFIYNNIVYDESLYDYLGLDQIHRDLTGGISGFKTISGTCVAVVDNLIDFNHPNLQRAYISEGNVYWYSAVTNVVLINNQQETGDDPAYEIISGDLSDLNPYSDTEDYLSDEFSLLDFISTSSWGHGTAVAGIINQIAPGAEIISVAMPHCSTTTQLYYAIMNLMSFLEEKKSTFEIKIVNNSNRWGLEDNELSQRKRDDIEDKMRNLLFCEYNKLFWVNSAGNRESDENNNWNLIYPSHLSDNWEEDFSSYFGDDALIDGKEDYDYNSAIATGFVSVGSIYDYDIDIGLRSDDYVYDCDMDNTGDLKLMASGFDIRTTTNTKKNDLSDHETGQVSFTGTSAAAPVVSGVAALLCSIATSLEGYEIEKVLTENALYDSNVNLILPEYLQKYGHGMINPLETLSLYDSDLINLDSDSDYLDDYEELYLSHTYIDDYDSDDDGWSDRDEYCTILTDPMKADTDSDNINDYDEYIFWGGKGISTAIRTDYCYIPDVDGDGLLDGDEINTHGTDPLNTDSDTDSINDYDEVTIHGTNPLSEDTDSDGMVDIFEVSNNLNPLVDDTSLDPDNDGLTNGEECTELTDPNNPDTDGDGMLDGWEVGNSLNPKTDNALSDPDDDGLFNIDEYLNNCDPRDSDSDNDGLNDYQEVFTYNTDPNDSDSDNDGWTDYFEVTTSNTSPLDSDHDNDGLSDKTEYYWWVNSYGQSSSSAYAKIKDYDSDNDGLSDGYEKNHNYNPLDNDMDNDGLLDGLEVNPDYNTDPQDSDSDNDGYDDLYEVINGTDPNDPTDYPGSGGFTW